MDEERRELLATFRDESLQRIAEAEETLLRLERNEITGDACVPVVFRHIHSLKGDGSLLELAGIVEIAHAAEELMDQVRSGAASLDDDHLTVLLGALDMLRLRVSACLGGASEPVSAAEKNLVARLRRGATGAAAAPSHEEPAARFAPGGASHLRVDTAKLDAMLRLCGEMAIARGRLGQLLQDPAGARADMIELHRLSDRLYQELQEQVMAARLVSMENALLRPCRRLVRDLARELGKPVRLESDSGDTEIDTALVEPLREAMTHMLRNALVHGIEAPADRRRAGKPEQGVVRFSAVRESGSLRLGLADDGAGLDETRLRARAAALGLPEADAAEPRALHELIFRPGFSTAEAVTVNSGRGVGMDVVRRNIESLRGRISLESSPGRGLSFAIRLPLSLSIIAGFGVVAAGQTLVVPIESVSECLSLDAGLVTEGREEGGVVSLRGRPLPFLRLRRQLGLDDGPPAGREQLLVVECDALRFGLAVDALLGETQAVIRPLAGEFSPAPEISGCTVGGDGRVALILDVAALARAAPGAGDAATP